MKNIFIILFLICMASCKNNTKVIEYPWYVYTKYNDTIVLNGNLLDTI